MEFVVSIALAYCLSAQGQAGFQGLKALEGRQGVREGGGGGGAGGQEGRGGGEQSGVLQRQEVQLTLNATL